MEPKTITSVVSTVKVTERPVSKKEIFKSSLEMVQRDLKEAEADISSKTTTEVIVAEKPASHRSSVFTRLGTGDLRAKITKTPDDSQEKVVAPLKRTIHNAQSSLAEYDTRESKVKRLENNSPSPNFIVTLNGADKLNIPLTSRLGPKRNAEMLDCPDHDLFDEEMPEESDPMDEDEPSAADGKENTDAAIGDGGQTTRCKFWPTCKNKDSCLFVHPSEPCKTFPACKFGAVCLFIHPNCRFSAGCSKPDCPYTHYGPRAGMGGLGQGTPSCRCLPLS